MSSNPSKFSRVVASFPFLFNFRRRLSIFFSLCSTSFSSFSLSLSNNCVRVVVLSESDIYCRFTEVFFFSFFLMNKGDFIALPSLLDFQLIDLVTLLESAFNNFLWAFLSSLFRLFITDSSEYFLFPTYSGQNLCTISSRSSALNSVIR